ncbi:hypothetical protein OH77DRAFT_1403027 [Trametes cingulata]|nr:hypothetical protein OH77DRAFT_1403027 [Trametes cingulata]
MVNPARLPTEIWREITTLACTDGGSTGRSLALTSKFFHSQSLSTRFHSLSFDSLQRVEDFLVFLREQPKDCKPQIAHLYLSFTGEPASSTPRFFLAYARMKRSERAEYDREAKATKELWDERFRPAAAALFTLAAPTLETLCLVEERLQVPLEFPHTFPKLEELTWKGWFEGLQPASLALYDNPYKFPVLRRVHFITHDKAHVVDALAAAASSSLTHLRISEVLRADNRLPDALARALGIPTVLVPAGATTSTQDAAAIPPSDQTVSALFPHLRNVVVLCTAASGGGWSGHYSGIWLDALDRFHALPRKCERQLDGVRMSFWDRPGRPNERWPDRLRHDWTNRMQGGPGCWVESIEEEEVDIYEDGPFE